MTDRDQLDVNLKAMGQPFAAEDQKLLALQLDHIGPLYCRMCGEVNATAPAARDCRLRTCCASLSTRKDTANSHWAASASWNWMPNTRLSDAATAQVAPCDAPSA